MNLENPETVKLRGMLRTLREEAKEFERNSIQWDAESKDFLIPQALADKWMEKISKPKIKMEDELKEMRKEIARLRIEAGQITRRRDSSAPGDALPSPFRPQEDSNG